MNTSIRFLCLTLWLSAFFFRAAAGNLTNAIHASTEPVFPGVTWERETNGLSSETFREVNAFVRTLDTTGLMVVRDGRVIYEYGDVMRLSYLASTRKSVLSMLYGPYVAAGKIRLDATLKDLGMSDVGGLLPVEEQAKVIDLITARSGVYHPASNAGDSLSAAPKRGSKEPGTYWLYSNWDFNAAGAAFEQMTGKNIYDVLRDDVAIPIGMQDFDRERQQKSGDRTRSQYSAYHLVLSTRDMARLGLLMLRQGQWRDRQIIPADWVRRSTSVRTASAESGPWGPQSPFGYGYMWWVWDGPFATGPYQGAYTAMGAFGQYITILPALDMVVAHKTWPAGNVSLREYLRLLDLLTGKKPASAAELDLWEGVPRRYDLYLGQYRISGNVTSGTNSVPSAVGIRRDGNRLLLDADFPTKAAQFNLKPKSKTDCFVTPGGNPVTFYPDDQGKVTRLMARLDGTHDISFERFSDQPPAAPAFEKSRVAIKLDPHLGDAYAGRYATTPDKDHPVTEVMTFQRDGNALVGEKFAGREPRRFAEAYFPESETNFFNTSEDEELTFLKNAQREVMGVIWHQTGTFGEFGRREYQRQK